MNKTKEAVKNFVSRSGHHDTEVHETINPAVTHENVKKTSHEEVNTAVDREVHHDHYHHTVQPVHDRKVLPEEHLHQTKGVEHREFDERDQSRTKEAVAAQAAKFKDERVVEPTVHTKEAAPTVAGEHHHHHIHETVQPVIQRETIQPTVVHTTIPIHETHHKAAKHHETTSLPAITMDEFKSKGGIVGAMGPKTTPQEHHYKYDGQPTEGGKIKSDSHGDIIGSNHHSHPHATAGGAGGASVGEKVKSAVSGGRRRRHHKRTASNSSYSSSDFDDTDNNHNSMSGKNYSTGMMVGSKGMNTTSSSAAPGVSAPGGTSTVGGTAVSVPRSEQGVKGSEGGAARDAGGNPVNTAGTTTTQKKPSLLNKLNPLTDADGDGKAGFMH